MSRTLIAIAVLVFLAPMLAAGEEPEQAAPAEDKAAPAEDKAAPAEDKAAPAEDKAAPAEDKAAPAEDKAAPAEDKAAVMKIEVQGVAIEPETESPVVILATLDKTRYLPIFIGENEAAAIWRYMNGVETPRPMAHDLLTNIISKLGGKLSKVTVTELKDNVFYARIEIAVGEDTVTIDARPSDSIALALKAGAEVYVAEKVMEQAGRQSEERKELPEEKPEKDVEPLGDMPTAI